MEEWRTIKGFNGFYEISTLGNVRRLPRMSVDGRKLKGRLLKGYTNSTGYHVVHLCGLEQNKILQVHRLVALTFLDPVEGKTDVNHKNGVKNDNRLENLEWCDDHDNVLHSYHALKRIPYRLGKPCVSRKLSREQVLAIRADERPNARIAADYDVCAQTIGNVKRRVFYKEW